MKLSEQFAALEAEAPEPTPPDAFLCRLSRRLSDRFKQIAQDVRDGYRDKAEWLR